MRKFLVSFAILLVVLVIGAATAYSVCVPTAYTVTASAPPPSANWTQTAGLWVPSGGFPGCAPGDGAVDLNASPTTVFVNSTIPNPIIGLNFSSPGSVINIQSGGQLTLAGAGVIDNGSSIVVSGGTLMIQSGATLTINNGGSLSVNGGFVDVQPGGALVLNGTSSVSSGGTLAVNGTLTVNNTFTINSSGQLALGGATVNGSNPISNSGTVSQNGATSTVSTVLNSNSGADVHVISGTLSLTGGGNFNAPILIDAGGILDFNAGSYTSTPNGSVHGGGTMSVSGATVDIGGVTEPANLTFTSGTITGGGFLSIAGTFNWSGGTLTGVGNSEIAGTGIGNWDGANSTMFLDGRPFNVYGYVHYTATTNPLWLKSGAPLGIYGTFDFQNDGSISCDCFTNPVITIAPNGILQKSAGIATSFIEPVTNNNFEVAAFSGTLQFDSSGTHDGTFISLAPSFASLEVSTSGPRPRRWKRQGGVRRQEYSVDGTPGGSGRSRRGMRKPKGSS